jgi:hypothetical protein
MSLSVAQAARPAAPPLASWGHGGKTALVVVLAFALLAAACVVLGPAMVGDGAAGGASAPDCLGACWERVI